MNLLADRSRLSPAVPAPGCCPPPVEVDRDPAPSPPSEPAGGGWETDPIADPAAYVRIPEPGLAELNLMVPGVYCAACIAKIERALAAHAAVTSARVNLSSRRLVVRWREGGDGNPTDPRRFLATLRAIGYPAAPFDPELLRTESASEERALLRALAVAGFAAGNVMLLSVSVWAGAASDMGAATRNLFHWISALIALPAVAFAGQPFFRSAAGALRRRSLNMDVPISLGVVLASAVSLFETMTGGEHAYFDASVTLLFFLLVGRYLDRRARGRARSAVEHLLALSATAATVIGADGSRRLLPPSSVVPGMVVQALAGDRIAVDGLVVDGRTGVDESLVTGETLPKRVEPGARVFAGTLNLEAPIRIRATASPDDTLLAEIVRLMEAAEQGRGRYVRLADRVARIYSPAVHALAAATFVGWLAAGAGGWHPALMAAVAVLIITCPCALGLAVPAVQVVATGRLLRQGILVKAADGLERLAAVDAVVLDKTGTLTTGRPELVGASAIPSDALAAAAALARESRHPLARALVRAAGERGLAAPEASQVSEFAGLGLAGRIDGREARLGRGDWCGRDDAQAASAALPGPELWLRREGRAPLRFGFADALRPDAAAAVSRLRALGLEVELLSGDREAVVAETARAVGIDRWRARCLPADKVRRLDELAAGGRKVLMLGDGLNDGPALAGAFASMSPASAADVAKTAADAVFQGERLGPAVEALAVARLAGRLARQNLALAVLYNLLAVPIAVLGLATPLVAAVAMSASSVAVTANALRLRAMRT